MNKRWAPFLRLALVNAIFFAVSVAAAGWFLPDEFPSPTEPRTLFFIGVTAAIVGGASGFSAWCFQGRAPQKGTAVGNEVMVLTIILAAVMFIGMVARLIFVGGGRH